MRSNQLSYRVDHTDSQPHITMVGPWGHEFDGGTVWEFLNTARAWDSLPGYHESGDSYRAMAVRLARRLWRAALIYRSMNPLDGCTHCEATGKAIQTRRIRSVSVSVVGKCKMCGGTGRILPMPRDGKLAAAGDAQ